MKKTPKKRKFWTPTLILIIMVVAVILLHHHMSAPVATGQQINLVKQEPKLKPKTASKPAKTACTGNKLDKELVVNISQRHLWACTGAKQVYDSPVVTGMEKLAADLTPTGTYHIYAKQTDLYLNGSDSTGSWHDYVNYWMPWLDNQYGAYGFHDATWRQPNDFGHISPDSSNASHGCVELPLATAKWIYAWAPVGTAVVIKK